MVLDCVGWLKRVPSSGLALFVALKRFPWSANDRFENSPLLQQLDSSWRGFHAETDRSFLHWTVCS
jgi:hypothetical protein